VCIALSTSPGSTAILDALERDIGKGDTLRHTPAIRLVRRLTSDARCLVHSQVVSLRLEPQDKVSALPWTPYPTVKVQASRKASIVSMTQKGLYMIWGVVGTGVEEAVEG
jgi:hypothetical protein